MEKYLVKQKDKRCSFQFTYSWHYVTVGYIYQKNIFNFSSIRNETHRYSVRKKYATECYP